MQPSIIQGYGASSLCWPKLHLDLPNQILRFRPPLCGQNRSAPQTPSESAIKYICKKGTFFWRHQDVLHPMAEYSSTPKGYSEYPPEYHKGYPHSGEHMGDNANWRPPRVIRAPRSGRILPRRDPIFELVNTVVNEVCKRAFSARRLIWSAGSRDAASAKKWQGMRPSILTIHRTVTTRRADFAVRLIRRDRRAPLMMLVHEECRITCDHRHSLWYLTGS